MSRTVIQIEDLSKRYRLGLVGSGTLKDDLKSLWYRARGKEDPTLKIGEENRLDRQSGKYIWALKDINLEVKEGEVLGIIGKNGAGKTTLLKILSRVTGPSTGVIRTRGRIASLLEVGTGMHPELTGRENVFLNGAILGMTKHEIRVKFDEIVDFAGVARYIDTPVKRYSSGMHVRLGFAVAAFLEPEILIVDEVLAVGDAEFQKKAIGKMQDVSKGQGRTVLFVSHNMASIRKLCTSAVLINNGIITKSGPTIDIIDFYSSVFLDENEKAIWTSNESKDYKDTGEASILNVELTNNKDKQTNTFQSSEDIRVRIRYLVNTPISSFRLHLRVMTFDGSTVFTAYEDSSMINNVEQKTGKYISTCRIPGNLLNSKKYIVLVGASQVNIKNLIPYIPVLVINVMEDSTDGFYPQGLEGVIKPKLVWQKE